MIVTFVSTQSIVAGHSTILEEGQINVNEQDTGCKWIRIGLHVWTSWLETIEYVILFMCTRYYIWDVTKCTCHANVVEWRARGGLEDSSGCSVRGY